MNPLLIMAGIQALSGAASAFGSYKGAQEANEASRASAREQMEFQERMDSTRWQRGRKDLEAAGYNPALAYGQGGASGASGASYEAQNELAGAGQASAGLSSAMETAALASQIKVNNANASLMSANAKQADANTRILTGRGPEAEREGEMYSDPKAKWLKPLMFFKSLIQPFVR